MRLKVQMLKAEVMETLLHGRATWNPNKVDYDNPRQVSHFLLLRCLG